MKSRMIKTKREIKLLKKSAKISNSCLKVIRKSLKEDVTEKEVARRIRRKIYEQGGRLAFRTLVASGKRSSMIHPRPYATDKKISGIGYVDFGTNYKGYRTDVTIPFVKGNMSKEERRIVKIVLKAYNTAINSIRLNEFCWKTHHKVDKFLKKYGFRMKHALGHGIGLKVHELPYIGVPTKLNRRQKKRWERLKKIKFQKNMVFTLEPAVYTKRFGVRLENDFLLTRKGLKALTYSDFLKV